MGILGVVLVLAFVWFLGMRQMKQMNRKYLEQGALNSRRGKKIYSRNRSEDGWG